MTRPRFAAAVLAANDARVEFATRDMLSAMLVVGFLVVTVGLAGFGRAADDPRAVAVVLWSGLAFAASVGFGRAFLAERDRGTWETLLALPVDRGAIYFAKLAVNYAAVLVTAAAAGVALSVLGIATVSASAWALVALVVVVGGFGVAAAGTLLAAVAAATRARESMVPVLLLPVVLPVLIAAVTATHAALAEGGFAAVDSALWLMLGYDMAVTAASWLLFEAVVA